RFLGRVSFYDEWFDSEDGLVYGGEYLVDLEAGYKLPMGMEITVGGQNVLDTYPEENPGARAGVGNRYSQFTPFGFNGAFWYLRMGFKFGR
ncbi:MAG: TonB-dependent receptor, partial [Myxococcales bacterium]|nr:TonB-dependent receptor [Myxococcales bacterium]